MAPQLENSLPDSLHWPWTAPWVLPVTAAVLLAGSLMAWLVLALFWLAARPPQPIVIRVPQAIAEAGVEAGAPLRESREADSEQHP